MLDVVFLAAQPERLYDYRSNTTHIKSIGSIDRAGMASSWGRLGENELARSDLEKEASSC